jgi:hypothetical protein
MSERFYSLHMLVAETVWGYDAVGMTILKALADEENQ